MSKETFAIINDQDQVVNHIIVDKDAPDFEEVMAGQLTHWNCVRYVETTGTEQIIILDEDPEIWTTHTDNDGFTLPAGFETRSEMAITILADEDAEKVQVVKIAGRNYPIDSLLFKENADKRPEGWVLPEGSKELSLADAE